MTRMREAIDQIEAYKQTFVSDQLQELSKELAGIRFDFPILERYPSLSPTRSRRARRPLSSTEYELAFGVELFLAMAVDAHNTLAVQPANRPRTHLLDIRSYVGEETQAAYELLESPQRAHLWRYGGPP